MPNNTAYHLKPALIWAAIIAICFAFLYTLCYLYPFGGDEYAFYPNTLGRILEGYIISYLTNGPRIGIIPGLAVLCLDKAVFNIISPLAQLAIMILSFFTVFLRMPDFRTLKDLPPFLLIMILTIFAVAQPDNNIFWLGGTSNYSWPFLIFLPMIIALRLTGLGKEIKFFKLKYANLLVFLLALALGMAGETLGPLALLFTVATAISIKLSGQELPKWLKIMLCGIIAGLAAFFTAPGLTLRSNMEQYNSFNQLSLLDKVIKHLPVMAKACAANLFLFPLTVILLLLCKAKNKLSPMGFIFPILMLLFALGAASALAMAPIKNLRPFYPASILVIIAFISTLDLFNKTFKINIFKYIFYAVFIYFALILPLFIPPFITLHKQQLFREEIINNAKAKNRPQVYLLRFITTKGPYDNLTIYFYDEPYSIGKRYTIETEPSNIAPKGQTHIYQY